MNSKLSINIRWVSINNCFKLGNFHGLKLPERKVMTKSLRNSGSMKIPFISTWKYVKLFFNIFFSNYIFISWISSKFHMKFHEYNFFNFNFLLKKFSMKVRIYPREISEKKQNKEKLILSRNLAEILTW